MAKKKDPKKGRNKKGKAPKKGSAKPSKKAKLKAAVRAPAKVASKKVPGKKGKKKANDCVPVGVIDFSTVMITEAVRNRVCGELKLSPQEAGYVTKVITSIWLAVGIVQEEPIGCSDSPLMPARTGERRSVDLGSLAKVVYSPELQQEVRSALRQANRASFVGPKGLTVLGRFVDKAKDLAVSYASAG